jgi:hypothetical protein
MSTQLLAYRFGPDAQYEGQLVGALERLESGGALRVRDLLFVQRDAETGELAAVAMPGDGAGGIVAPLIGFRLDASERRRATGKALGGAAGDAVQDLGAALAPGEAMALVLVEHLWARVLEDAVARLGGTPVASEFVDATALAELAIRDL